jgi:predicted unusual protein kinase regulating ubiquinone biosynthesis (AarF/ABC1/UbiB family)
MHRARYRRIVLFFARVLFSLVFWDLTLPRLGLRSWSQRTRPERLRRIAVQFREVAIQMGGVLIKVGQFLSARLDVLPVEITQELSDLQDEVPEEDYFAIRQLVEAEFGLPLEEKFAAFAQVPQAAASLGQVHRAQIAIPTNGLSAPAGMTQNRPANRASGLIDVVVKVQRPGIEQLIATDLAALRTVGEWLRRYRPIRRRADVPALMAEFTRILYEEIDYLAEGRNAETFASNFRDRPQVRVPAVVWTHTTRRVLTLEDVGAIKINDYEAITAAGVDPAAIAERLFQTYLQQIFEDGFFHADPHPGNLFVTPLSPPPHGQAGPDQVDWLLTFVDFGMVGRMSPQLRAGMRELAIALGTRDAARLVRSYQQLNILLPDADLDLLEEAESKIFDRFWGMSMAELREINPQELIEFAQQFRQLIYTMPVQFPEDLILLGRMVGILSGICTGLNPHFNVWDGLAPYAQKLIAAEAASSWGIWAKQLENMARSLVAFPRRVEAVLVQIERGELATRDPQLSAQVSQLERAIRRGTGGLIFIGLLLGGVQLYLAGEAAFSYALLASAGLTLVWVIFAGRHTK